MDYGHLFRRAGEITWRYKFLWVFGIVMAIFGQGSGGSPNFRMNYSYRNPTFDSATGFPEFPAFFPEPLGQTPIAIYMIIVVAIMLVFGIVSLAIGAIGRSALIKSVARAEANEDISLSISWKDGMNKAVPVGLLQVILYSPFILLFAVVGIIFLTQFYPLFTEMFQYAPTNTDMTQPPPFMKDFFTAFPIIFSSICGLACIGFIIQIVAGLFSTFGSRAIVLEDSKVLASFSRSWSLLRQNIGTTIIIALLIFAMAFVISLVLAIPAMIVMFPLMMSTMPQMLSEAGPPITTYVLMGGLGIILFVVFSIVNGIFQVFVESLWTLVYQEFANKASYQTD